MSISAEILELLRKYASGRLTEEERTTAEKMLRQRPELREEVELAELLIAETEELERARLLEAIRKADAESRESWLKQFTPSFSYGRRALLAAASVLLLAAAGLWWFFANENEVQAFRAQAYFEPDISAALRGAGNASWLEEAGQAYQTGRYRLSLEMLDRALASDSLYLYARWLAGHNHYQLGNYEQAITAFDEILTLAPKQEAAYKLPNIDNVGWSRILAFLGLWEQEKNTSNKATLDRALAAFLQSADPTDKYHEEAVRLRRLLRE